MRASTKFTSSSDEESSVPGSKDRISRSAADGERVLRCLMNGVSVIVSQVKE